MRHLRSVLRRPKRDPAGPNPLEGSAGLKSSERGMVGWNPSETTPILLRQLRSRPPERSNDERRSREGRKVGAGPGYQDVLHDLVG